MRTLLINCPYPASEHHSIPMGLAYIAAVLEKEGIEVQVQDFLVATYSPEKSARKIAEYAPEIVGINSVTLNYPIASKILHDCKRLDGNIVTVIGGPHVSFTPRETLEEAPWIDVVVMGEGEYTMLEIAQGKELRDIDGIAFRENNRTIVNKPRQWIENLDELPHPARGLFPLSKYRALLNKCGLITSRGCPFNCIFCVGHKMVGKRARFRNPKLIVDEIEEILNNGFKAINIVDDLFTINRKHVYAVCDEIMTRKLKFDWTVFSRVDTVNRELLARMKEAGCYFICYGVESGNKQILDTAKKKITPQKTKEAVKLSKEAGIRPLASFIIGLPGETKETLHQTVDFAKELGTDYGFHLLAPFPGTEVRDKANEYGIRILTDDWLKYDANQAIVKTDGVTAQDLNEVDREYWETIDNWYREQEELESEGKLSEVGLEQMRIKRHGEIVSNLVQRDIIENLGRIKAEGDVIEELATRLSNEIPYPFTYVRKEIGDMVREGLLKYEICDGGAVWRWG